VRGVSTRRLLMLSEGTFISSVYFGWLEYRYNPLHSMDGKDPSQLEHVASVCYYTLPIRVCVV
jgi:hypothetical protein